MAIGQHVKKYLETKAAEAAKDETPIMSETPETPTPDPNTGMAQILAQIAAMQQETARLIAEMKANSGSGDSSVIEKLIAQQERLIVKTRPENPDAPMISDYNPLGERDHPKPPLKCPMFWVGYDLRTDTLTPMEVELLNQLQPGEFRVTKADGTKIPLKVEAKYADTYDEATGRFKVEKMNVWFPTKGDHRQNHGSMVGYLRQVLYGAVPSSDELQAEVARLKAELASAKAGLVGAV